MLSPSFINKLPSVDCLSWAPMISVVIGVVLVALISNNPVTPSRSGSLNSCSNFCGSSYQFEDDQSICWVDLTTLIVSQKFVMVPEYVSSCLINNLYTSSPPIVSDWAEYKELTVEKSPKL